MHLRRRISDQTCKTTTSRTESLHGVHRMLTDKSIKYADVVIECAENHFAGTLEYIYAEELYATVLALRGETEVAKKWYNDALERLVGKMADMKTLRENIEISLAGLNEK